MLCHQIQGTGDKHIIFAHGNSQSRHVWDDVIATGLLKEFTLVTVDLPGHGDSIRSNDPAKDYSLIGGGDALAQFIKGFTHKQYIVVAASIGTNFFAEAVAFIENCKGALFIGACIIGDGCTPADILQPNPAAIANFMNEPSPEQLEDYLNEVILDRNNTTARRKYKQTFLNTDRLFRGSIAKSVGNEEWSDEIKNLRNANVPVALVYGDQEAIIQSGYLQNVPINKWKNEIIFIKDAGHSVQLDQPEMLAGVIKEFAVDCFK